MTTKLPCAVVRDILPMYAEKMTEEETKKLVEEHLEYCAECRKRLDDMDANIMPPVESTMPLRALKREIRKRRWFSAIIAALLVFVVVYAYFYHDSQMEPIPWQDGLIEVEGIETRPYEEVYGDAESSGPSEAAVDVFVLKVDGIINGMQESCKDEDGMVTVILQGWSSKCDRNNLTKNYNEMILNSVPDRLLYVADGQQRLLWGEPMDGNAEAQPLPALALYFIVASVSALVLGVAWLFLRNRKSSWIPRQLFLLPLSYVIAHLMIKGAGMESFFMGRDLMSIVVVAIALYVLLSLVSQIWLEHKKTV